MHVDVIARLEGPLSHKGPKETAAEEEIRLRAYFRPAAGYINLTKDI